MATNAHQLRSGELLRARRRRRLARRPRESAVSAAAGQQSAQSWGVTRAARHHGRYLKSISRVYTVHTRTGRGGALEPSRSRRHPDLRWRIIIAISAIRNSLRQSSQPPTNQTARTVFQHPHATPATHRTRRLSTKRYARGRLRSAFSTWPNSRPWWWCGRLSSDVVWCVWVG